MDDPPPKVGCCAPPPRLPKVGALSPMLPPPNAVLDAAATAPKADAPPKAGADPNAGAEPNAGAPPNAGGAPKAPVFDGDVALVALNPWLIILLPVPKHEKH